MGAGEEDCGGRVTGSSHAIKGTGMGMIYFDVNFGRVVKGVFVRSPLCIVTHVSSFLYRNIWEELTV